MQTDWSGRTIAIISLVISLLSVGYLVTQDRVARSREDLQAAFKAELTKQNETYKQERDKLARDYQVALDRQDQRLENWNGQLVESLKKFDADAQSLMNQIATDERAASDTRRAAFRRQLAVLGGEDPTKIADSPEPSAAADNTAAEVTGPSNDASANANTGATTTEAVLLVAKSALRPSGIGATLITLRNVSDTEAEIDRVRFIPRKDFVAPKAVDDRPTDTNPFTSFTFTASDNKSPRQNQGLHGAYDMKLTKPVRVPAGENLTLRLIIEDTHHVGYGFTGDVIVYYNGKAPVRIDNAQVVFRAEPSST